MVETNKMAVRAVEGSGGATVIDVGISVGTSGQFTASVTWARSELALLAECDVDLCVSAYPATEEEEADSDFGPAV